MVLLLALSKKKQDETTTDILNQLKNSGAIDNDIAKDLLTQLLQENLCIDNSLTFLGIQEARQAEQFFKI